jgi:NADH-quinone oxidoreductase subunit G
MSARETLTIDGRTVAINGERNLLELVRKAGLELPTFCYHSELSVYGACRLCLVDVAGRGLQGACSTPCEPGLDVRTNTEELREIRRITIELLLANHGQSCPTCPRSESCQLQNLARQFGIEKVRFAATQPQFPVDRSSAALVRDPNKCVLCGDCVRVCREIQGIGAIDFAYRGAKATVMPAFGKNLGQVECVHCGQCARVCPTGALTVRSEVEDVWRALDDRGKTVVAQIAPAVRVALGEAFGLPAGEVTTGQIAAALRAMGFKKVFDTCFTADMTVIEEATEFLRRKQDNERLPQFTSCCPAWVRYAEQYCSDLLPNLSSCRSPQQMFGAVAKSLLPEELGIRREDLVVVSIMPCVAKKVEAGHPQFAVQGRRDVDHVLTTQELVRMIRQAGICFHELQPDRLDLPFGYKTGAGIIFGVSGGVSEAVLRYAVEKITNVRLDHVDFHEVRGEEGVRTASFEVNGQELRLAVVHGLRNAKEVVRKIRAGEVHYDLIEVMACPGGCVGGAGQPITRDPATRRQRARGLYDADKTAQLHKSQDNHMVTRCYEQCIGPVGGERAHDLLHRHYESRRRITGTALPVVGGPSDGKLPIQVCVGTNCHVRGSQKLMQQLLRYVEEHRLQDVVDVQATFCFEQCDRGPTVTIGKTPINRCTVAQALAAVERELQPPVAEQPVPDAAVP